MLFFVDVVVCLFCLGFLGGVFVLVLFLRFFRGFVIVFCLFVVGFLGIFKRKLTKPNNEILYLGRIRCA